MKALPIKLKIYLFAIYFLTIFSFGFFVKMNYLKFTLPNYGIIIFLGILMGVTESFGVIFRSISFTTSFAVIVLVYLLYGPLASIIVTVIGLSVSVVKSEGEYLHIFNIPFYKTAFNYCLSILPILYGDYLFVKLGGVYSVTSLNTHVMPIVVFCITFYLFNVILMGLLFAMITNKEIMYYIVSNIKLGALNFFAMAPLGILAAYMYNISFLGLITFIIPIVLARFTFSQYIEANSKYIQTVDVIMRAMEARDKYTEGHSQRVAGLACGIARELKYSEFKIENLNIASLLHDVGKIGIDDIILNKPGKLTKEEYEIIKKHPEIGYNILKDIKDSEYVRFIVKYHHERYDGLGYPEGKKANELSMDVFIVQLADSIDAMATDRPYRNAMSEEEIMSEIIKNRGTQFHPVVVDAYLRFVKKDNNE